MLPAIWIGAQRKTSAQAYPWLYAKYALGSVLLVTSVNVLDRPIGPGA